MIITTVINIFAVLMVVGLLLLAVTTSRQAAERAERRLMIQETLFAELEAQTVRIADLQETNLAQTALIVTMIEDQLELLIKVDAQTEAIRELVTEVETLQEE